MTFLGELRSAALQHSDVLQRKILRDAADELQSAIVQLAKKTDHRDSEDLQQCMGASALVTVSIKSQSESERWRKESGLIELLE